MDKTFDNSKVRRIFEDVIVKPIMGKRSRIEPTEGKKNIKYDMIVYNSKFGDVSVEVKTRKNYYNDIAVEATQYESESKRFKRIIRDLNADELDEIEAWELLRKNNTGWLWKSEAQLILYIKPNEVLLFSKKSLVDYIFNNLKDLSYVKSDLTTGAYNFLVPQRGRKSFQAKINNIDTRLYYSAYLN